MPSLLLPLAIMAHSALANTKLFPPAPLPTVDILPPHLHNGSSSTTFVSSAEGLDGVKVRDANATAYDWWCFDAVGEDAASSVAVVFCDEGPLGFLGPTDLGSSVAVQISGTFPNGTLFDTWFPTAGGAAVVSAGQASSAPTLAPATPPGLRGWTRQSTSSASTTTCIRGLSLSTRYIAPPHYPCSPVHANESMEVMSGVGWTNAVPAARASIDVAINGTRLQFEGLGYHDKNWGVRPLREKVHSWYWGHATVGPYVVVWLTGLDFAGTEHCSGYVARDGKIIYSGCGDIEVRPVGAAHPPVAGELETWEPRGFTVAVDLGPEHGGLLRAEVTATGRTSRGGPVYARWAGTAAGSVRNCAAGCHGAGGNNMTGIAGFEMFSFAPAS
ncbi:hypothetical protein RB594_004584 [Gaeumannomyces avenae]